jgi:hypothetical protein
MMRSFKNASPFLLALVASAPWSVRAEQPPRLLGRVILVGDAGALVGEDAERKATQAGRAAEMRAMMGGATCDALARLVHPARARGAMASATDSAPAPRTSAEIARMVGLPQLVPQSVVSLSAVGAAAPKSPSDDVLRVGRLLKDLVTSDPDVPVSVVFLGDNVYDRGVAPEEPEPESCWALFRQLEAACGGLVADCQAERIVFVPGNHDWNSKINVDRDGAKRVCAESRMIRTLAGDAPATLEPQPHLGCPGPAALDLPLDGGRAVRLIAIDTEAALQGSEQGCAVEGSSAEPDAVCRDHEGLTAELWRLVQDGDPHSVLVAGHHPLRTFGPHGGHFEAGSLPDILASLLRPTLRHRQDVFGEANMELRRAIRRGLGEFGDGGLPQARRPLAYIAGHEHSLQVIRESDSRPWYLVSGSGAKKTGLDRGDALKCGHEGYGLMVLFFYGDGSVTLELSALAGVPCPTLTLRSAL